MSEAADVDADERDRRVALPVARRLVEAARACVIAHGVAGATFVVIEREAQVTTGTVRYYFGTKERLLVEVLRADSQARLELLRARLAAVASFDEFLAMMVASLDDFTGPAGSHALLLALLSATPRSPALAAAQAELYDRWRRELVDGLEALEARTILRVRDGETFAALVIAVAHGIAIQQYVNERWDRGPLVDLMHVLARFYLAPPPRGD